jgi:hypothetical protein
MPGRYTRSQSPRGALRRVSLLVFIVAAAVIVATAIVLLRERGALVRIEETVAERIPGLPRRLSASARAELEAAERAGLVEKMDRLHPLYAEGEQVALRTTDGIVHRGVLVEKTEEAVVLADGDEKTTLELAELDTPSRSRCDPTYRERYIARQARLAVEKSLR